MKIHAIEIDSKVGSAYIYIEPPKPGASVRQVNLSDAIILDIGKNGTVIGVEILHPEITAMLMAKASMEELEKEHIPVTMG
jgi:uncharacterized protein YuzE